MFWLEEWGYDGWYGLDLFPYREPPEQIVAESVRNLHFARELLGRIDRNELRQCFQTSNAVKISQLMRQMLGGKQ